MLPLHSVSNEIPEPYDLGALWFPLEWVPAAAVAVTAALYVWGVVKLVRRGDAWHWGRTASFLIGGLGSIFVATQGPLARLDTTLLWTHMVQHMILTMVAPIFLGLGAPITLALRTLPQPLRRALLWFLNSRYAKIVASPLFAGFVYILNPWVLYFTPYYQATLTNDLLHNFNHFHFLVVGCVWFWSLVGIDPMPRMGYPFRLLAVFVTLPFHAFLGVTIMDSQTLIASGYYETLVRSWGPSIAEDQQLAGGLLWTAGDVVGVLLFVVLMMQWAKASAREAKRIDRELDRQDAEAARLAAEPTLPAPND